MPDHLFALVGIKFDSSYLEFKTSHPNIIQRHHFVDTIFFSNITLIQPSSKRHILEYKKILRNLHLKTSRAR